jgi:hypothetical protein
MYFFSKLNNKNEMDSTNITLHIQKQNQMKEHVTNVYKWNVLSMYTHYNKSTILDYASLFIHKKIEDA